MSFFAAPLLFDPVVLVLGLTPVAVPLPPAGTMPCILWPAPDVLLPMPYTAPPSTGQPFFELPLPPALRPITFHAQAVRVTSSGLQTTNAMRVDAN